MNIYEEIKQERKYQDKKWGELFDNANTVNDWASYVMQYMSNATKMGVSLEDQRRGFMKAATILVAACQTFDRNGSFEPRHYD